MGTRIACAAAALGTALVATGVRAETPYSIDVVMPLTGGAAFLGKGERQSLEIAEKAVNAAGGIRGRPLELQFHDDQSDPQTAVVLTGPLVAQKPAVILGSSLIASCRAMAPLMKNGPVEYCFSPGIHPEAGYVFSASLSTLDLIGASVRYLRLKGMKRLALMFSTDATGQDAEQGVKSVLAEPENREMQVAATAHFNISDMSVAAQLETLKAARPDALIAWSTGAPIATIFRGVVQAGLDVPVVTTAGNMTYAQMQQYAGFLPKRLIIAAPQWVVTDAKQIPPAVAQAHKVYFDAFAAAGVKPDQSSDLPWDATMIIVAALRQFGPAATAEQVRGFIAGQRGFAGIEGLYDFVKVPQRGIDIDDAVVTEWDPAAGTWIPKSGPRGVPLP